MMVSFNIYSYFCTHSHISITHIYLKCRWYYTRKCLFFKFIDRILSCRSVVKSVGFFAVGVVIASECTGLEVMPAVPQ